MLANPNLQLLNMLAQGQVPEDFDQEKMAEFQAQLQAQQSMLMAGNNGLESAAGFPGVGASIEEQLQQMMAMQGISQMDFGSEDEYIDDEEFQKSLSEQERTIFNALVISINQTHMIRQKNFQKRRAKYLEQVSGSDPQMAQMNQLATAQAQAVYQNQLLAAGLGGNMQGVLPLNPLGAYMNLNGG